MRLLPALAIVLAPAIAHAQRSDASGLTKLHADIAHPIHADCRQDIEHRVITAYHDEVVKSKQPGYVAPSLDEEDLDVYDPAGSRFGGSPRMGLHPAGTAR